MDTYFMVQNDPHVDTKRFTCVINEDSAQIKYRIIARMVRSSCSHKAPLLIGGKPCVHTLPYKTSLRFIRGSGSPPLSTPPHLCVNYGPEVRVKHPPLATAPTHTPCKTQTQSPYVQSSVSHSLIFFVDLIIAGSYSSFLFL